MRIEASPTGFSLTAIDECGRLLICGQTFWEGNEYANRFVEVPQLPPVTRAAAGADRCAAVTADGRLFTWGGGPVAGCVAAEPRCVAVNPKEVVFPRGQKVTDAAVGDLFSAALTASDRLYRWGESAGAGTVLTETGRGEAGRTRMTGLSCGYGFAAAPGEDGRVYVWGGFPERKRSATNRFGRKESMMRRRLPAAAGILRFCTATERCRHGEAAATAGSERAVSGMNRNRAGLCRRTAAGC